MTYPLTHRHPNLPPPTKIYLNGFAQIPRIDPRSVGGGGNCPICVIKMVYLIFHNCVDLHVHIFQKIVDIHVGLRAQKYFVLFIIVQCRKWTKIWIDVKIRCVNV